MSSSATIINICEGDGCVQQPSSSTSGVPIAPSNTTTTRHRGSRKRTRSNTSSGRANGESCSNVATTNPTRLRRTTPRRVIDDDLTPADRAISDTPLVRGTSDIPLPPTGICQGSRRRSSRNPSSDTPLPLVRGTSDVPLPPTGRLQGSRRRSCRNTSVARTYGGPGSSSARADGEPGISSDTADGEPGSSDASSSPTRSRRTIPRRVIEDDLTPAERAISDTPLLRDLGKHPSVYARAGRGPLTKNLNFRGAWHKAVELYREANYQYKDLFDKSGFGDFLKIEPLELPQGYLIALMERWFAETNTLHLPCCEIGPTPVDWTMITGLCFGGESIKLSSGYTKEKALELLGDPEEAITENKIRLSKIKPNVEEVRDDPPTEEAKKIIFRRLFLYVVGSCFFGNNRSVIHYELVQFLENVDEVRRYNWGAITYAAFLAGMRRKVTRETGSFSAFWQFLLFWAFEYLDISRPEHSQKDIFPRAMRWNYPQNLGSTDIAELTATRCQLDYVDHESQVTWQPYLASEKYNSAAVIFSIALSKNRVRFLSFDTWEYYLGERCRRQLGLPCMVPHGPPKNMHGHSEDDHEDVINFGILAESFVNEGVEYASWFANKSIGKIVDVTRVIGGPVIGRKVIDHWMAKHRPGMVLISQSEVKEIREARQAANAECTKLREELSLVGRNSNS